MGEKIKEKKMSGRACSKQAPINARRAKSAEARSSGAAKVLQVLAR
jgi:hypothetical protein